MNQNQKYISNNKGFSLVELSIVLAILGVIVGGVLVGQTMIHSTKDKNFIKEDLMIQASLRQFYDQYNALPGDMANATQFWGAQHTTAATCITTASTTKLTCNGNGNGEIQNIGGQSYESYRLWQHLMNAGLIAGKFNGTSEFYPSAITPNFYHLRHVGTVSGGGGPSFDGEYGHSMAFFPLEGAPLLAQELANIDEKYDDGMPATGNYVGITYPTYRCSLKADLSDIPAVTEMDAVYNLTQDRAVCNYNHRNIFRN